MPDWPAERRVLRITVVGGGPVALVFAALVSAQFGADEVRIRIFDGRWRRRGSSVDWKGPQDGNLRRQQVVTIQ